MIPKLKSDFTTYRIRFTLLIGVIITLAGIGLLTGQVVSQEPSEIHPTFAFLDTNGNSVLESGGAVSTMQTCGSCHDTAFIESHSFHADVGLSSFTDPGQVEGGQEWDTSPGFFGRWNPINYRYLSPEGDAHIDLTTPDWMMILGARHVGGGPTTTSRDGQPLTELEVIPGDPQTHTVDPETGELIPWDWRESGVVEMNCFLCHTPNPDNVARTEMLQTGQFQWANTATLAGTKIVERSGDTWEWNPAAFDSEGRLLKAFVTIQEPTDKNCGQCHGLVQVETETPLVLTGCEPAQWSTLTTGQIVSPQRLSDSGINLIDKDLLGRSWDVHAERVVACTDCHYSLNNPVYYQETDETRPDHLLFDPRRIDLGEYLYRPLHQFAKGQSAQSILAPELDNSLRRCESCHSIENNHDWLPFKEQHTTALSCETCHIPQLFASARQTMDWTVVNSDGTPRSECRGIAESGETFGASLFSGFEPVLLPRQNGDGTTSLAPHNLITAWFWVYGDPQRPVPQRDLQAAYLDGDTYHPEVLAALDADGNGTLDESELILDTPAKTDLIGGRLQALGLDNPHIVGQVWPYSVNHTVAHGEWVTRDCQDCHSDDSRIKTPMLLANNLPGDTTPTLMSNASVSLTGDLVTGEDGALYYQPRTDIQPAHLYILGHDSVGLIDTFGVLAFLGVLVGIGGHAGLRYWAARRLVNGHPELKREYMYSVYERLWHWLQTMVILSLIFTGLVIHKPDTFSAISFDWVVVVHNILAAILVINAALAAFYHLVSGEIRQYLPEPHGFFGQAFVQAKYYLHGIFRGEEHPFEKTRQRKMNPLQQITYLMILNVLLPLQVITGALMWGAQRWPEAAASLGGLPFLAPLHTLVAWSFAAFVVMHVYLTTTGHTPLANIKAMIMGWDDVEVHPSSPAQPSVSDTSTGETVS